MAYLPTLWQRLATAWRERGLHHLVFWLGYTVFWYILFMVLQEYEPHWIDIPVNLAYLSAHMAVSYTNLYGLMPRFLARKQYPSYFLLVVLLIAGGTLYLGTVLTLIFHAFSEEGWGQIWNQVIETAFWSVFTTLIITSAIKLYRQWRQSQRRNQELEKHNLQTELQLLKAQLNPHFLFNAINSIYFLIPQDPDRAADALARFSDILRYQLYECHEDLIPLDRELAQLEHFIELARLRRGEGLTVMTDFPAAAGKVFIPPFLLIPLLENAFKYVSAPVGEQPWVRVAVRLTGTEVLLHLENTVDPIDPPQVEAGGIGLTNIRRRLALLYPGESRLDIQATEEAFCVRLRLPAVVPSLARTASPLTPQPLPYDPPVPDRG